MSIAATTLPTPAPPSAETVSFCNVSKSFGSTLAVDSVSFDIAPGEFFSLLGPSGCGKTTTLRLLAGFERPDMGGGEIRIGGALVNGRRPYERNLGMVFQNYALFPHLTVERNVALARALVVEPPILLLDEPLGALDLKLRKDMQLELKALNRESGITFVYVTHDQEEALTMSDRIAVMDSARIAQIGTPAEIYEQPRTAFVARFIGESSFIEGKVVAQKDQRVTVERADGSRVDVCGDRPVGERACVAIRPENLALEPVNSDMNGHNAIRGTVSQLIYRGDMLHVRVAVDAGEDILVALRNRGQLRSPVPWQQGQRVSVTWDIENGRLLEDDPA